MKMMKQTIVGGCLFLCGCSALPMDTSHFTPPMQLDYPARTEVGMLQAEPTRRAPMLPAPARVAAGDRLPSPTSVVPLQRAALEQAALEDAVPRRANSIDISEGGSRGSSSSQQDVYRYGADGRPILPPSQHVEIIDISSINKALEADNVDADVVRREADAANANGPSDQVPATVDPLTVGAVTP